MSVSFQPQFKKALLGRKIVGFIALDVGGGQQWPALRLDDGSMLVIQQDSEGNGGGFMSLLNKDEKEIGCAG